MKKLILFLVAGGLAAQNPIQRKYTCEDAGVSDAFACSFAVSPGAYATGEVYRFKANTANTDAATANFNTIGAVAIKKVAGGITTDLATNDIRAGQWVEVVYDGTNFQMVSASGNASSGGGGGGASFGLYSARPTCDIAAEGKTFFATDGGSTYVCDGSAWAKFWKGRYSPLPLTGWTMFSPSGNTGPTVSTTTGEIVMTNISANGSGAYCYPRGANTRAVAVVSHATVDRQYGSVQFGSHDSANNIYRYWGIRSITSSLFSNNGMCGTELSRYTTWTGTPVYNNESFINVLRPCKAEVEILMHINTTGNLASYQEGVGGVFPSVGGTNGGEIGHSVGWVADPDYFCITPSISGSGDLNTIVIHKFELLP